MSANARNSADEVTLDTVRLQLRQYSPEHYLALIEGTNEFRRSFGLPVAEGLRGYIVSSEIPSQWIEQLRTATGPDLWVHGFAIVDRESETVIGNAGFKGAPDDDGMVEIAYGVAPGFERRGIATEAAGALVSFVLGDPRVRLLRAHTLPENNASARVLQKNGFSKVGEVIDPEDGLVWRWERAK